MWTAEEAARICRDKMVRLRSLYVAQFKRLQHVLKEKRRKYLHALQAEQEDEHGEEGFGQLSVTSSFCKLFHSNLRFS